MMVAPAKLPPDILNKLNAEFRAVVKEPEVVADFTRRGLISLDGGTPEQLQTYVRSEIIRWGEVSKRAGVFASQ